MILETLPAALSLRDYAHFYVNATLQRRLFQTFVKLAFVLAACGGLAFEFFANTPARDHWIGWLPVGFAGYVILNQFVISPCLAVYRESRRPYVRLPQIYRIDRRGLRRHL